MEGNVIHAYNARHGDHDVLYLDIEIDCELDGYAMTYLGLCDIDHGNFLSDRPLLLPPSKMDKLTWPDRDKVLDMYIEMCHAKAIPTWVMSEAELDALSDIANMGKARSCHSPYTT